MKSCTPVRPAIFARHSLLGGKLVIACTVVACGDVWLAAIPCGVRGTGSLDQGHPVEYRLLLLLWLKL